MKKKESIEITEVTNSVLDFTNSMLDDISKKIDNNEQLNILDVSFLIHLRLILSKERRRI